MLKNIDIKNNMELQLGKRRLSECKDKEKQKYKSVLSASINPAINSDVAFVFSLHQIALRRTSDLYMYDPSSL